MARYRYFTSGNTIVCVSSFAGKSIRGIAKCNPGDVFDEELGKKLAKLRCDLKVAEKRKQRAVGKELEARINMHEAAAKYAQAEEYLNDADREKYAVGRELEEFIDDLYSANKKADE